MFVVMTKQTLASLLHKLSLISFLASFSFVIESGKSIGHKFNDE